MRDIHFYQYDFSYKSRQFRFLYPVKELTEWLVTPETSRFDDYITFWDGNRAAFETMAEAAKIMSQDKYCMVYFPLRHSEIFKLWQVDTDPVYGQTAMYDMIWMHDTAAIAPADVNKIRNKALKAAKYFYPVSRTSSEKDAAHRAEIDEHWVAQRHYSHCPYEIKWNQLMCYRLPKEGYAKIARQLDTYLADNLENKWWQMHLQSKAFTNTSLFRAPNEKVGFRCKHDGRFFDLVVELGFTDSMLIERYLQYVQTLETAD